MGHAATWRCQWDNGVAAGWQCARGCAAMHQPEGADVRCRSHQVRRCLVQPCGPLLQSRLCGAQACSPWGRSSPELWPVINLCSCNQRFMLATTQTSMQGAATRRLQGLVPFMKARTYRRDGYPQQTLVEPKLVLHTTNGEDRSVRGRCFRSLSCDQRALCERVPWSSPCSDMTVVHARAGCMCACWWATVREACVKACVQRVQERVPCRQSFGMGDQIIGPVVPVVHALLHNKQNGNAAKCGAQRTSPIDTPARSWPRRKCTRGLPSRGRRGRRTAHTS